MPKQPVTDLITDQEIAFARLVLSGTMTDRQAAEAAGLNPDTAAYTKAKPRVRDWMREHRAAAEQQLLEQEAAEQLRRSHTRERVLARLWVIAELDPEATRNSASAQIRALSMIIAIEGLNPDRRAAAPRNQAAPAPVPEIYRAAWLNQPQEQDSEASPALAEQQIAPQPPPAPPSAPTPPPAAAPSHQAPAPPPAWAPRVAGADFVPDIRFALPERHSRRL